MRYYEYLYFVKDNPKLVPRLLNDFLLYQIYSPTIIRRLYPNWLTASSYLKQNTPLAIHELIEKSPHLSNTILKKKLNEYQVRKAIDVLSQYQACDVPITQDPTVHQTRLKLTSDKGDKALTILQNACAQKQFSDQMADLAVMTSHKFLADDKYYGRPRFPKAAVDALAIQLKDKSGHICYSFPAIQLTRGCMNHCSHCDSRAEPHLSHMPWPVFRGLYRRLNKFYKNYPQNEVDYYFSSFFADSDMLDYHDPITDTDSGDVGLWISEEKGYCQYLTRGVKNELNRLALAKALVSGQPVDISFVDTPKENMTHNLKQLNETLDVAESVPDRRVNPHIIHLHLKSGPSVSSEVFRQFPFEQKVIYCLGRAKDFPPNEVDHPTRNPDYSWVDKIVLAPNGDIDYQKVKNDEVTRETITNIFLQQMGPKIGRTRLFFRRHILPVFKGRKNSRELS